MNRGVLVIVLHHVALQEFLEAVKDQFTYDRLVKVLNQKWGETCKETVREWFPIHPVDDFGGGQIELFQKFFFKSRSHLVFKDVAYQQFAQYRTTAFIAQYKP